MARRSGWVKWAVRDPIAGRSRRKNRPYRYTVHMAVTESNDIYGPGKGPGGTYAHYYHPKVGKVRQHQDVTRWSYADLFGNGNTISGETEGVPGDRMTDNQLESHARAFADAVLYRGVPNRIATWDNTHGLAWHRLGCRGNFGRFDPHDPTTWCTTQTGVVFSTAYGKTCPTDNFIRQIPDIYDRAQKYIRPAPAGGTVGKPKKKGQRTMRVQGSTYYRDEQKAGSDKWRVLDVAPKTKSGARRLTFSYGNSTPHQVVHVRASVSGMKQGDYIDFALYHLSVKNGKNGPVHGSLRHRIKATLPDGRAESVDFTHVLGDVPAGHRVRIRAQASNPDARISYLSIDALQ